MPKSLWKRKRGLQCSLSAVGMLPWILKIKHKQLPQGGTVWNPQFLTSRSCLMLKEHPEAAGITQALLQEEPKIPGRCWCAEPSHCGWCQGDSKMMGRRKGTIQGTGQPIPAQPPVLMCFSVRAQHSQKTLTSLLISARLSFL